jgi:antitoxin component of MazEF toxin-antitoxin module
MVLCRTKKWGNSLGLIIPKDTVRELGLSEDDEVEIDMVKKNRNVLRELFEFGRGRPRITRKRFLELRKEIESKF